MISSFPWEIKKLFLNTNEDVKRQWEQWKQGVMLVDIWPYGHPNENKIAFILLYPDSWHRELIIIKNGSQILTLLEQIWGNTLCYFEGRQKCESNERNINEEISIILNQDSPDPLKINYHCEGEFILLMQQEKEEDFQQNIKVESYEKKFIGKKWSDVYLEILPYSKTYPVHWSNLIILIEETGKKIEVPPRGIALRILRREVERIIGHLRCLQSLLSVIGADSELKALQEYSTSLLQWNTEVPALIVGGIEKDISMKSLANLSYILDKLRKLTPKIHSSWHQSFTWKQQAFQGGVNGAEAIYHGYSGILLRSAGLRLDWRKIENSCDKGYEKWSWRVPLGDGGRPADVANVRLWEIEESCKIINQILEHLPTGEVKSSSLLNSSKQLSLATLDSYFYLEAPHGEIGIYLCLDAEGKIEDLRFKSCNYRPLQKILSQSSGQLLRDVFLQLTSIQVLPQEMQR